MNESHDPLDELNPDEIGNSGIPSEMEKRLMQCRPRSPQLDMEAIVRKANIGDASKPFIATGQDKSKRFTTSQLVSTIAASWVCGAVVGSACILFSISAEKPTTQNRDPIASNQIGQANDMNSPANASKLMRETNPQTKDLFYFDWDTEQLQVGMSLPSRGRLVRAINPFSGSRSDRRAMIATSPNLQSTDDSIPFSEPLNDHSPPARSMTQGELLKELSRDAGFRIH
jgi:hypothetical protein